MHPNPDLPEWWTTEHDLDLLKGCAIYGVDQNDKRMFLDPSLSFSKILTFVHRNLINSNGIV